MHIALVHRDLHQVTRGGICTVYRNLADRLADRGHTITLITQDSPAPLPAQPRPGISVLSLPRTEDLDAHRAAVADAVATADPDIAECSTWEAELLAYAETSPVAPVVVRAEFSALTLGATDLAAAEHRLLDEAAAAMAVSAFAARDIQDAYGHQLPIVPNGVDRTRFSPGTRNGLLTSGQLIRLGSDGRVRERQDLAAASPDTDTLWQRLAPQPGLVRLLWVGKATGMKGFDRLQDLLPHLAGRAVVTVVFGHGWVQYPVTLDDAEHVQVVQDVSDADLPALYRSADHLLSTSRWEGFGLAIAEALACATPVLLPADLATAAELLTAPGNGATWRTSEDLLALLHAPEPGRAALDARFDWGRNAEASEQIYIRALADRAREPQR